jgi:broad specificity phosphatase PhoE
MKISIVRHGETDSNKAKKLMGKSVNEPLNPEGIKQAYELAKNISRNGFDVIFTSPLKRAQQTAEIIADKIKVPVIEKSEIEERDFGNMAGKSWDEMINEVKSENVNFKEIDFEQKYDYRPYGGECVEDVRERVLKFIDELKTNYSDKKVLVVAHGGIMKLLHLLFLEKTMDKTPDNMAIHEFEI